MPRKNQKAAPSNELDVAEFFAAIELIEKEKGIPQEYMLNKITSALAAAYNKDHKDQGENLVLDADPEKKTVRMFLRKEVVETVDNPAAEISLEEAREKLPQAMLGDVVSMEVKPRNFGRIAAQTARQVIIQGMREAERNMIVQEFSSKEHEILTGLITRVDPRTGGASIRITSGSEWTEAYLAPGEQIKGELYQEGNRIKVYVVEVRSATRGPQVLISRTHPGLVRRLIELEVPEVYDGTVEVKSIAREAGSRTKVAVWSSDPNVDPRGACIGPHSQRVNNIVGELKGEKLDIIRWSDEPAEYVAAALEPADVISVTIFPDGKSCRVIVPDDQLSLAIGKEGQNARLAAKLTGFKIDIKPESAPEDLPQEEPDQAEDRDGETPETDE